MTPGRDRRHETRPYQTVHNVYVGIQRGRGDKSQSVCNEGEELRAKTEDVDQKASNASEHNLAPAADRLCSLRMTCLKFNTRQIIEKMLQNEEVRRVYGIQVILYWITYTFLLRLPSEALPLTTGKASSKFAIYLEDEKLVVSLGSR